MQALQKTPRGLRLHIAIFGRRNVGKSTLLNVLTRQDVSIVSDVAGTTTDPVEKAMELLPIGPVLFIDTAGIDDIGALGEKRVSKTYKVFDRADIIILVTEANAWTFYEKEIIFEAENRKIPILVVFNKMDLFSTKKEVKKKLKEEGVPYCEISCFFSENTEINGKVYGYSKEKWAVTALLKQKIIALLPKDFITPPPLASDLVSGDGFAVLVIPIDKEAPKGRIILPQQQVLRDLLDKNEKILVVNEKNLLEAICDLKERPEIIITDSQAFGEVFSHVPGDILTTSFSILFARFKGDLIDLVKGANTIDKLKPQDNVLIAEACTHHPIGDDIGREKIPGWIKKRLGFDIDFDISSGRDYPQELEKYKLIIHCGACTLNRREMLTRIYKAKSQGVPITNYGVAIAHLHGRLERALEPFPYARACLEDIC
ncbi:MAG: [FeFe] hydrogenase H-cluster maturation GTPase HydF [Desulfobacteraceae bacterium]|nr:[FeFe] hydrogenase H-cluster maturation GTPase HydF [Desulfobacteraceae bacterium]